MASREEVMEGVNAYAESEAALRSSLAAVRAVRAEVRDVRDECLGHARAFMEANDMTCLQLTEGDDPLYLRLHKGRSSGLTITPDVIRRAVREQAVKFIERRGTASVYTPEEMQREAAKLEERERSGLRARRSRYDCSTIDAGEKDMVGACEKYYVNRERNARRAAAAAARASSVAARRSVEAGERAARKRAFDERVEGRAKAARHE